MKQATSVSITLVRSLPLPSCVKLPVYSLTELQQTKPALGGTFLKKPIKIPRPCGELKERVNEAAEYSP
jgi:hypothetical protein